MLEFDGMQEKLGNHMNMKASSRYLFPTPTPSTTTQHSNPNPHLSYNHLLPPGPAPPINMNMHYPPPYPSAFTPNLVVNPVADCKSESKRQIQDQEFKKKMSDEQLKNNGSMEFEGSCHRCGEKYHKAIDCPQKKKKKMSHEQHKIERTMKKMKKMSGEQSKNNDAIEVSCFRCGEKGHKVESCPQQKKTTISDEQPKKNDNQSKKKQGHCQQLTLPIHGKSIIGSLINKLCLMRFDGEESVCEYILEMENLVCRLRELNMEVSDDLLVHMVLNSLPEAFDTVKLEYYSTTDVWNVNELIANCVHQEACHEQK